MILLLFELQPVQTFLAKKVLQFVSVKINHEILISKVKISWLDRVSLEEVLIRDFKNDTLVYAKDLMVNYKMWNLINGEYLNIEELESEGLRLKLTKYDSISKINILQFFDTFKKDTVKGESKPLIIDHISFSNLQLSIKNQTKIPDSNKLDFSDFNFIAPDFTLATFSIKSDTIAGSILQLQGRELNSGFNLKNFSTVFEVSTQSLSVDNFNFETPTSHIADSLKLFYNGFDDYFGSFVDSVSFVIHLRDSRISKEDIKTVLGIDAVKNNLTIDGIISGTVSDFNIDETIFGYGDSYVIGEGSCVGLPDLSQTFVYASLTDSHLIPADIEPYIGKYVENLEEMGKIDFRGSFVGFLNDFVANGDFITEQGSIHSDINLKIPQNPLNMSYIGKLELIDINLGMFLRTDFVQKVNLDATINGKGISAENADFELKALIYNSSLKGYVYDSIEADGKFAQNYFEGNFFVRDPNCILNGTAKVDFRQEDRLLKVDTNIETFNAYNLNLTKKAIVGEGGKVNLEVRNLDIDDFEGQLSIDSVILSLNDEELILDSIRFNASFEDSVRILKLAFPDFESSLRGTFKVSDLLKDIPIIKSGYASKLKLVEKDTTTYEGSGENYKLFLNSSLGDISSYLRLLDIPIFLGGQTRIESSFRRGKSINFSLFMELDTLIIGRNEFHKSIIELNGSRDINASDVLTNFIFESEKQIIPGIPDMEDFLLEGVWLDDNIDITTIVNQPETESNVRIESNLKLYGDSLILRMLPSDIKFLDDNWNFNPTNKIVFTKKEISISNMEIHDFGESIAVEGVYADSLPSSIIVSIKDLNVDKAKLFSQADINGFLNGNFKIFKENVEESFELDGSFLLKDLTYDELILGDVSGHSQWNAIEKSIYTEMEVEHDYINTFQVKGYYYPQKVYEQFDFDVTFNNAELKIGQPVLLKYFSDIEGVVNGALKLTGSVISPEVIGSCHVESGAVNINYLNAHYKFDGQIDFSPGLISLVNFDLTDRNGSDARASGEIKHDSFQNLNAKIKIRANDFEFLNTTSLETNPYYGLVYGTGTIDVEGPLNDLNISASIRTEAGTRFFVPVSEGINSDQEEYVTFIDFSDTTKLKDIKKLKIFSVSFEFDIEVTQDAYCEFIFDQKTKEIIQVRGSGNLKLKLDSDDEFNIFGTLNIEEGSYNFKPSLGGTSFLSKIFEVSPGSSISWFGEPYSALLDFQANYLQRASFENLKNVKEQDKNNLNKKIPLLVTLDISGPMLSPDIDFDIKFKNPNNANDGSNAILTQIRNDEQELRRQIISLLFLKRFTPKESFFANNEEFNVSRSVSEMLSNQLNYLVSEVDENFELEMSLADLNNDAFNTIQLRVAYTWLDGRLKITRGGSFENQSNTNNNNNTLNNIIGDLSVEYRLIKNGKLKVKVFRNSNQRILINENRRNQEIGISLKFVHSFNDFRDVFSRK